MIINFKEIPYTSQVYRFMDKIDAIPTSENTLFLECQNLFYKLIMLQGEIILVTKSKSMEKFRIYHCSICNRGFLEENNWVLGKTRLRQSKLPMYVRNIAIDEEQTDGFTGYLKSEKLKCICDSKRLAAREKILINYQEIVIKLSNQNRLTVLFEGNGNESFKLGQKICVTGYLINHFDKLNKNGRCEGTISMYAMNCSLVANIQHEVLREEVMAEVPQPDQSIKRDIINKNRLIRSFCPKIKKKHFAKLFMLLALVSGTSYMKSTNEIRSQIHVLFVGPSGSHKFDLMRAASNIVKESKYIPLAENLGSDFVFMMNKKQDTISFEAGPLLMGNKDITFMHDINLVHSKNKDLLNEILFSQKIKKYLENANYEIALKTAIIASCEPLYRVKSKDKNGTPRSRSRHRHLLRRLREPAQPLRRRGQPRHRQQRRRDQLPDQPPDPLLHRRPSLRRQQEARRRDAAGAQEREERERPPHGRRPAQLHRRLQEDPGQGLAAGLLRHQLLPQDHR